MKRSRPHRLSPPSGAAAPIDVATPDGGTVDVRELAKGICGRYRDEFPDEQERYGDAGRAWCVHDNQYILSWALLDARGTTSLDEQIGWLARVLAARAFPLERLRRNLELAADAVEGTGAPWAPDIGGRLRAAREAAVG